MASPGGPMTASIHHHGTFSSPQYIPLRSAAAVGLFHSVGSTRPTCYLSIKLAAAGVTGNLCIIAQSRPVKVKVSEPLITSLLYSYRKRAAATEEVRCGIELSPCRQRHVSIGDHLHLLLARSLCWAPRQHLCRLASCSSSGLQIR